jgi:hypothetical protein
MESLTFAKLVKRYNNNNLNQEIDCLICFEKIGFAIECKQCKKSICSDCIFKIIYSNIIKIYTDDEQKKENVLNCPYCNFSSKLNDMMGFKIINFKHVKNTEYNKELIKHVIEKE